MTVTILRGHVQTRPTSHVATDQAALTAFLEIHATPNPRILDCSWNHGKMWRGLPWQPHRFDIDPALALDLDTVGDFLHLDTYFPGQSFDVIVFDPPHVTEAGRTGVMGGGYYADSYGSRSAVAVGASITPLFAPFLAGAAVILAPGGVVLAKIANQVHRGRQQWQADDFKAAAVEAGFTRCDEIVKTRRTAITGNWATIRHVRKVHSYWLCVRLGKDCHRRHASPAGVPESPLRPQKPRPRQTKGQEWYK